MADFVEEKKEKFGVMDFECQEQEASCNFCVSYNNKVK
jgi:hypothetical protein